jgi:hypothetical protein
MSQTLVRHITHDRCAARWLAHPTDYGLIADLLIIAKAFPVYFLRLIMKMTVRSEPVEGWVVIFTRVLMKRLIHTE